MIVRRHIRKGGLSSASTWHEKKLTHFEPLRSLFFRQNQVVFTRLGMVTSSAFHWLRRHFPSHCTIQNLLFNGAVFTVYIASQRLQVHFCAESTLNKPYILFNVAWYQLDFNTFAPSRVPPISEHLKRTGKPHYHPQIRKNPNSKKSYCRIWTFLFNLVFLNYNQNVNIYQIFTCILLASFRFNTVFKG